MAEDNSSEDEQKVTFMLERLLNEKGELDLLMQLSLPDLQKLVVAIRGRVGSR
jgi:hypothetical protein